MEAMACGLPVVCSDIRGNRDLVENGKGGYLVNPSDLHCFAERISSLENSRSALVSMGDFNRIRVEDYNSHNVLVQLERIYRDNW
jgi:glycosyltransferase involved in cell wall biosynthesis